MVKTQYFIVDPDNPQKNIIDKAADLIKQGELVAFPTETVYGLGATAFQADAVNKIFVAKGRPAQRPLLIHVNSLEQVYRLVSDIPPDAERLIHKYWPGPLSIILSSLPEVPEEVRGGKTTVGLRMPSHPVALALIKEAGPIAAPSANLYGRPSPVKADHVRDDLDGRIAAVLDAGSTGLGVESTIIDMSQSRYRILRKGGIAFEEIEETLGTKLEVEAEAKAYKTGLEVIKAQNSSQFEDILVRYNTKAKKIGVVYYKTDNEDIILNSYNSNISKIYYLDLNRSGGEIYSILRDAEESSLDILVFPPLPDKLHGIAAAIADRISRAAKT